jgi:hypothetical protein
MGARPQPAAAEEPEAGPRSAYEVLGVSLLDPPQVIRQAYFREAKVRPGLPA